MAGDKDSGLRWVTGLDMMSKRARVTLEAQLLLRQALLTGSWLPTHPPRPGPEGSGMPERK